MPYFHRCSTELYKMYRMLYRGVATQSSSVCGGVILLSLSKFCGTRKLAYANFHSLSSLFGLWRSVVHSLVAVCVGGVAKKNTVTKCWPPLSLKSLALPVWTKYVLSILPAITLNITVEFCWRGGLIFFIIFYWRRWSKILIGGEVHVIQKSRVRNQTKASTSNPIT